MERMESERGKLPILTSGPTWHASSILRERTTFPGMADMFEAYERQYCEKSSALSQLAAGLSASSGDEKKRKLQELKQGVDEAEALIRRMDLEARSVQAASRATLLAKLREYKADLANIKRDFKKGSSDPADDRDQLLELGMASQHPISVDQRTRLIANTDKVSDSSTKVKDGRRLLVETEELGVSILNDLHQQRQTLLHARESLHGVDDGIGRSRQILGNMAKRMDRNKWIMASVVGILLVAVCLVLYAKFSR